jgi:hypothetical protein
VRARITKQRQTSRGRTLPLSPSGGLVGLRGAAHGPQRFQRKSDPRLLAEPQRPGGKMTAEVAILNMGAVALAADSKVSIGSSRTEKTYDTQNKIFTLSKVHPVGIMVYNNADFMEFPWETIIKLYRDKKKDKSEPTIEAWARDFVRFLKGFGNIKRAEMRENLLDTLHSTFEQVEQDCFYYAVQRGVTIPSAKYEALVIEVLELKIEELRRVGRLMSATRSKAVLNTHDTEVLRAVARFVPSSKNTKLVDTAIEFAGRSLIADYFSPSSSGFVIAGFGRDEVFPSMIHHMTDGYIGSQIKLSPADPTKIAKDNRSAVTAFAQHEIVGRFMEGIDPGYSEYLRGLIRTAIVDSNIKTFEKWAPKALQTQRRKNTIEKAAIKQYDTVLSQSLDYRREEFW